MTTNGGDDDDNGRCSAKNVFDAIDHWILGAAVIFITELLPCGFRFNAHQRAVH